jgi:hypothetical protein
MQSRKTAKQIQVCVLSGNPKTLGELRAYFDRVGIPAHGSKLVRDAERIAAATTAVVLFPDDFELAEVEASLRALRRDRPHVVVVLITREPARLGAAIAPDGRSIPPIVLPRPSFGWTILDAIREHDESATT